MSNLLGKREFEEGKNSEEVKREFEEVKNSNSEEPPKNRQKVEAFECGSEEPKVVQKHENPAGFVSPKGKCSYCTQAGHEVAECRYRISIEKAQAKAKSTPPRNCEMCSGPHITQYCPIVAPFRQPRLVTGEDGELFYLVGGNLCDNYEPKYLEPEVEETISEKQCKICYEEHYNLCSHYFSIQKGQIVSPFYGILCRQCDRELDDAFWCCDCKKEMNGYVVSRDLCQVCGKRISPNCCPYGRRIFSNFCKSHPSGNGAFWPLFEYDS